MEVELCIRADGAEIPKFFHGMKKAVDKGWPDDMAGVVAAEQAAELTAQALQRRQRYIDYTLKGLRPRYLQRKAQEYLMEHPNATWNDFSTNLINKDVSYQVSISFLNDEEQNKAQMASLEQELKNLQTELKEHRINALEGNQKTVYPNPKKDRMLQGFVDIVEPMDTPLITAERRCEMKKLRCCRTKPQPGKRLRSPINTTKDVDLPTDVGIGLDGMMIIELWCQPQDHLLEEISGQTIKTLTTSDKTDLSNEEITRIPTKIGIMSTQQTHHNSRTKINLEIGEVTTAILDRLQPHGKIPLSQISADNPDQTRRILQCLTGLEIETPVKIYLTTKNSQHPTIVTSQT